MNASDAVRFLAAQAQLCRDRDDHEALCLLLPALMRVLELRPMNGYEEAAFRSEFKKLLEGLGSLTPECRSTHDHPGLSNSQR